MSDPPRTRWERSDTSGFGERFAQLVDDGEDLDGEARLADVLAPRGASILDAGSGMGRVADALARRGHDVTAVEKDAALLTQSRETYPSVDVVQADLLDLTPAFLAERNRPTAYDVIVVVGNVMVFVAEDTEREVLRGLAALLAPGGRMLVGFQAVGGPRSAATYPEEAFRADLDVVGLEVDHRFGTYDLRTGDDPDYAVWVLSARTPPAAPAPTA